MLAGLPEYSVDLATSSLSPLQDVHCGAACRCGTIAVSGKICVEDKYEVRPVTSISRLRDPQTLFEGCQ